MFDVNILAHIYLVISIIIDEGILSDQRKKLD